MSDNKSNVGKQDDIRVDANDPSEVAYIHKQFPELSLEAIKQAIEEFGPMRADIEAALKRKQ